MVTFFLLQSHGSIWPKGSRKDTLQVKFKGFKLFVLSSWFFIQHFVALLPSSLRKSVLLFHAHWIFHNLFLSRQSRSVHFFRPRNAPNWFLQAIVLLCKSNIYNWEQLCSFELKNMLLPFYPGLILSDINIHPNVLNSSDFLFLIRLIDWKHIFTL